MVGLLVVVLKDGRLAALVLASTAFSFIGGAIALLLSGGVISLGSVAGFVALFGLATRSAVLLVTPPHELHAHHEKSWTLKTMAVAAAHRAAPILMTSILVALAIAPLLFTRAQAGGESLGPMAAVIVGGVISGATLTLLFLPALIYRYSRTGDAAAA
jgi:Cu/Ag efflux pump CusA